MIRHKIVLFLFLFVTLKTSTQNREWLTYDVDGFVSLKMPFDAYEIDTIVNQKKYYELSSSFKTCNFVAQKFYLAPKKNDISEITLPNTYDNLKSFYLDFIWSLEEVSTYTLDDFSIYKNNKLTGYRVFFKDSTKTLVQQINLIYVNKNLYLFSYTDVNGLQNKDQQKFFNNIFFDDKKELIQYSKSKNVTLKNTMLILVILFIITFIIRVFIKRKNQHS